MSARRRVLLPAAILGVGALGVVVLVATRPRVEAKPPEPRVPLVRALRVEPQAVQLRVRAQGSVVPRTEGELVPEVAGRVVWVSPNLVSGGFFRRDEPLLRIEPSDYRLERESARAALARARSELDRARTERERQRILQQQGVASQARIDDTENTFRVAEASWHEAQARLARAERDLARTELRAPYDGRVRSERVAAGQFVSRGSAVATLYAVDFAEVRIPLPDRELRYLDLPLGAAPGRSARDDGPGVRVLAEFAGRPHEWEGRIVRSEGEIDPRSRMLTLVARVEDPYGLASETDAVPLSVGLFVEVEIAGRELRSVYVLPRTALRLGPGETQPRVHVIDAEGRLRIRPVEVLRSEADRVIVGQGLHPGERVSLSPLRAAVDGMSVRVAAEAPEGAAPPPHRAAGHEPSPS